MHTLKSLGIKNKVSWSTANGHFSKGMPWKKIKLSKEEYQALQEEVKSLGWNNTEDDRSDEEYLNSDVALCKYYVYKSESSAKRGLDFDLSLSDFKRIVSRKRCFYTGEHLVKVNGKTNTFTLDRIDNTIGYTKENTVPCAQWVNELKSKLFEDKTSSLFTNKRTLAKILSKIK